MFNENDIVKKRTLEVSVSNDVTAHMIIDVFRGEHLDTCIEIRGQWVIAGIHREEFIRKLGELIDAYRI